MKTITNVIRYGNQYFFTASTFLFFSKGRIAEQIAINNYLSKIDRNLKFNYRMKKIIFLIFTISFITFSLNWGQVTPVEKGLQSITTEAIKAQLGFLASDWTEGRETGEKGEFISSDYIASMLRLFGVRPGGDFLLARGISANMNRPERSYFQNFVLLRTEPGTEQILKIKSTDGEGVKTVSFTYNVDFSLRPSFSDIEIEAPVVFAGYGFKNDNLMYNDFRKLDIKGKFILKISGVPAFAKEKLTPVQISAYFSELEKIARNMGAAGIIEFNPNSTVVGRPVRRDFNNMSPAESNQYSLRSNAIFTIPGKKNSDNLIRITVSVKTANEILKGTSISIEDYISKADKNSTFNFPLMKGKSVYLKSGLKTTSVAVRNVIGIIEGNNPDQVIVLGAHYDHMGMRDGYIWNGADDNASGTVGVMTLARAIMETGKKPEKSIVIALWTAEEKGLLGSRYYIDNLTYPLKNLRLNVNFDMISRYIADNEPNKVIMTYSSSCPAFKDITEENLKKHGFDLKVDYQPSSYPPGGSDHQSFVASGVPVMRFKPGHRDEYHTPEDEISTTDWDIMEKIIRISFANVWELANNDW